MGAIFSKLWGGKCRTEDKNVPRQRSQKRSPAPGQSRDERRDSRVISVPPQSASKPAVAKPLSNQVAAADVAAVDSVRLPNPAKPSTPQIYKTTFEQNLDDDLYEDVIDIDADIVDHELDQRNNDTDNGAETEAAVIKIQAGVRGFLARQNVKNIKRERSSEPEIPIHIEPEVDAIIVPPPEQFTDTVASSLSNAPEHSHDREIHLAGKVLESPETNKKFVVQPVVENVATVINVLNPSEVQAGEIKQIVEDKITEQIKPLGIVSSSLLSTEQPSSKAVDSVQAEVNASSPQTVSHTSTETVPEERQLIPQAISKVSEVVEPKLEELKTSLSESVEQIKDDVQNTFASAFHSNLSSIVTGSAPEKKSAVEVQQELEKDVNALSDTLKNDLQSHHQPAVVLTPEEPCSETSEFTSDAKKEEAVVLATKSKDKESSNIVVSADDVTTLSSSDVTSSADARDSVEEPETAVHQEEVLSIIAKPVTLNQALPLEDAELVVTAISAPTADEQENTKSDESKQPLKSEVTHENLKDEPCELQLDQQPLQSKLETELLPEVSVTQDDDQLTLDNVQPLQEQEAAVRIQAAYRGFMTRKQIAQDQHEGRHDSSEANYGDAVESVSSIADSYLSDNSRLAEELNIRVTPEPEEAATKIQAAFRGYQVRKTLSREPSPLPTDEFQGDSYQQEAETSAKSLLGGRTEGDLDAAEAETVAVLEKLEADLVNQLAADVEITVSDADKEDRVPALGEATTGSPEVDKRLIEMVSDSIQSAMVVIKEAKTHLRRKSQEFMIDYMATEGEKDADAEDLPSDPEVDDLLTDTREPESLADFVDDENSEDEEEVAGIEREAHLVAQHSKTPELVIQKVSDVEIPSTPEPGLENETDDILVESSSPEVEGPTLPVQPCLTSDELPSEHLPKNETDDALTVTRVSEVQTSPPVDQPSSTEEEACSDAEPKQETSVTLTSSIPEVEDVSVLKQSASPVEEFCPVEALIKPEPNHVLEPEVQTETTPVAEVTEASPSSSSNDESKETAPEAKEESKENTAEASSQQTVPEAEATKAPSRKESLDEVPVDDDSELARARSMSRGPSKGRKKKRKARN